MNKPTPHKGKCWLWFHDWSKWSDPQDCTFTAVYPLGKVVKGVHRLVQFRKCLRCCKLEEIKTI